LKSPIASNELPLDAKGSNGPAGDLEEKGQRVAAPGERHRDKNRRTPCAAFGLLFSVEQSSFRARAIAILQSPYSFIGEPRKKLPRLGMGPLAYRFSGQGKLG